MTLPKPGLSLRGNCLLALAVLAWGCAFSGRAAETSARIRRGAALYVDCAQCHGEKAEGIEAKSAPRLAGREDWFIKTQIERFRRRERGRDDSKETGFLPPEARTQFMHPVADRLTRSDLKALIAYLSTLQPDPVTAARAGDRNRGRDLYTVCIECHGKSAEGNRRRDAPRLTEQHDWYLFNQLRDYRMGWRGMDSKDPHVKLMRRELDLDDDRLRDLTAYIVSLNTRTPSPPDKR